MNNNGFYDWDNTKSRNAYILFYDRVENLEKNYLKLA
jgi:hypothetical protein